MPIFTQAARVFEIVARSGSIRKASERINMAPSAINRQVLNLEAELGTALFSRHSRGMNLTEAGKLLVDRIRSWQAQEEALRNQMEMLKGRNGHLRLGIMECFSTGFMSTVYRRLSERCGKVSIELTVGGTRDLADKLLADELDLAVAFNMPGDLGFRALYEAQMAIGVIMGPDALTAQDMTLDKARLQGLPLVLADRSLSIEPIVRSLMTQMGMMSQAIATSNSVTALKQLVAQGAGVSFLTWADVREEVSQGKLTFLPVSDRRMFELLSVYGRNPAQMSPTTRAVADIIIAELKVMESEAGG